MKLLRYYNFVGRGFSPASQEFRADIVAATFDMLNADDIEGQTTVGVFFKRKIFRAELGVRGALKKEASFRESIFKEMIKAGRSSSEAVNFYLESIACVMRASTFYGFFCGWGSARISRTFGWWSS